MRKPPKYPKDFISMVNVVFGTDHTITQAVLSDNQYAGHHLDPQIGRCLEKAAVSDISPDEIIEELEKGNYGGLKRCAEHCILRRKLHQQWQRLDQAQRLAANSKSPI